MEWKSGQARMEQAIHEFIVHLANEQRASANTLGAYRTDLRQLHDFMMRRQVDTWSAVGTEDLQAFVGELTTREYAPTSIVRKLAAVKSFFQHLSATGLITGAPTWVLAMPAIRKAPPHGLSAEEIGRLFAQLTTDSPAAIRDMAMLHTLYATGMRVSEVIAVNTRDVDAERAHIFCPARGGHERILPLTPPARMAVAEYLAHARAHLARGTHSHALFLNHHGDRLTRQGFWLILKRYARAAGLGDITPHTLRHAFALDMLAQGMELRGVQQLLGHANLSTTQVYRRFQPDHEAPDDQAQHVSSNDAATCSDAATCGEPAQRRADAALICGVCQ